MVAKETLGLTVNGSSLSLCLGTGYVCVVGGGKKTRLPDARLRS